MLGKQFVKGVNSYTLIPGEKIQVEPSHNSLRMLWRRTRAHLYPAMSPPMAVTAEYGSSITRPGSTTTKQNDETGSRA